MAGEKYVGEERIPGKTAIVTGANTGLGKATAKELANRGKSLHCIITKCVPLG